MIILAHAADPVKVAHAVMADATPVAVVALAPAAPAPGADLDPEPARPGRIAELEWLGFRLGFDGVLGAPAGVEDEEGLAAFARGHDLGDTELWAVDPLFAAAMKERAEGRELADRLQDAGPLGRWSIAELIESGGVERFNRLRA